MNSLLRILILILALALPATAEVAPSWHAGFGPPPVGLGLDGDPRALLYAPDGSLYAGGSFSQAGPISAWFVARLDENFGSYAWTSLGDLDNRVDAMVAWGDSVLIGGRFTDAAGVAVNRVAVWDGAAWQAVGSPAAWTWGHVLSLAVHDGTPWAAGTGFVVRWTGSAWETVTGSFTGDVFALASYGGELYAGGAFASITNPQQTATVAANIARWNGTWQTVGAGLNGTCYVLAPWNGDLVAGGVFSTPANLLGVWDGSFWNAVGGPLSGNFVTAVAAMGLRLFVGGDLYAADGSPVQNVTEYVNGAWWDLGGGLNGMVRTIASNGSVVAFGGGFTTAGSDPSAHLGVWIDPSVGVASPAPGPVTIHAPYPNPFNPRTSLAFNLAKGARVSVAVHGLDGRRLAELLDADLPPGDHRVEWSGCDRYGRSLPSGVYVLRLRCGDVIESRRVQLLK